MRFDTLGDRLDYVIKTAGTTQKALAEYLDVSTAAVSQWIKNYTKPKYLHRIEDFFAQFETDFVVTAWWLSNGGDLPKKPAQAEAFDEKNYQIIPSINVKVCCGKGFTIDFEEVGGGFAFRKEWISRMGLDGHQLEIIRATGKSMEPTIFEGNILLVDRSDTTLSKARSRVYVVSYDGDVMIKRVLLTDDMILLESDNDNKRDYKTIEIKTRQDGQLIDTFRVIGRVVWQGGVV